MIVTGEITKMNILRSLEQERAGFAYTVLNIIVSLKDKEESRERINSLIELVINEKAPFGCKSIVASVSTI
jgi:hypothetical protein